MRTTAMLAALAALTLPLSLAAQERGERGGESSQKRQRPEQDLRARFDGPFEVSQARLRFLRVGFHDTEPRVAGSPSHQRPPECAGTGASRQRLQALDLAASFPDPGAMTEWLKVQDC